MNRQFLILMMGVGMLSRPLFAATGVAEIRGTAQGSTLKGSVSFVDTKQGLQVSAQLTGVASGKHGFHIHEFGSCADLGKAAGGHFNPLATPHGHSVKDGVQKSHGGDMGNLEIDVQGNASLQLLLPGVSVSGVNPIAGRAVIVHEKADDFSQPLGNAGGRIGCGAILITSH